MEAEKSKNNISGSNIPLPDYELIGAPFHLLNGKPGTLLRKLGFLLSRNHCFWEKSFNAD